MFINGSEAVLNDIAKFTFLAFKERKNFMGYGTCDDSDTSWNHIAFNLRNIIDLVLNMILEPDLIFLKYTL